MPNVTHAAAIIGIEKEFFQEEIGADIQFKPLHFIVGNNIVDAFITKQIDASYIGPGPFINAKYRKIPIQLIANASNAGTLIVGKFGIQELSGSRIAVPQFGNTQDLILRSYLRKNNLLDKVKIFAIPPQDTGTAFFTMSIDAACLVEPWGTVLLENKACDLIVNEKSILNNGDYPAALLVVSKNYAKKNPLIISKLVRAHMRSLDFIKRNPDEVVQITGKIISNISKKQINNNIIEKSIKRCSFKNEVNSNAIKELKAVGVKARYYKKDFLNEDIFN